jgi:hypothetical protein
MMANISTLVNAGKLWTAQTLYSSIKDIHLNNRRVNKLKQWMMANISTSVNAGKLWTAQTLYSSIKDVHLNNIRVNKLKQWMMANISTLVNAGKQTMAAQTLYSSNSKNFFVNSKNNHIQKVLIWIGCKYMVTIVEALQLITTKL